MIEVLGKERRFELDPDEAGSVLVAHVIERFKLLGTFKTSVDVQTVGGVPTLFIVRVEEVVVPLPEEP